MPTSKDIYVNKGKKWLVAALFGLLFLIIASPMVFLLVNGLTSSLGLPICDKKGCPNSAGLIVHGIVFILIVRALLMISYSYESFDNTVVDPLNAEARSGKDSKYNQPFNDLRFCDKNNQSACFVRDDKIIADYGTKNGAFIDMVELCDKLTWIPPNADTSNIKRDVAFDSCAAFFATKNNSWAVNI